MWLSNLIAIFFVANCYISPLFTNILLCLPKESYLFLLYILVIYLGKFCANSWASSNNKILIKDKIHIIFSHITKILLELYITCDW